MDTTLSTRQFSALILVAVVWVGALAYWNTTANDFVWDDVSSFLVHKNVQDPAQLGQLFKEDQHAFGRGQGSFYRPLLSVSFMADFYLAYRGPRPADMAGPAAIAPFVFHVTSALWHIAAAAALFAVLARFGAPRFVQALVPVLYAVHPLHTEAVTYMSGRADSMSAAFIFLGMWCALGIRGPRGDDKKPAIPLAVTAILWSAAAGLCALCAALSKESGMLLVPLLLLMALTFLRCGDTALRPKPWPLAFLPFAASTAALAYYTVLRRAAVGSGGTSSAAAPLSDRLVETAQALALYMKLIVAPAHLHMERTLEGATTTLTVLGAIAALLLVVTWIYGLVTRKTGVAMGAGIFLLTWFPISGIIPLNAPMAEHWLYVPLAGLLWVVADRAAAWTSSPPTRGLAYAVAAAFFCLWLAGTIERNRDWHDNATLFEATLNENPNSMRVRFNLAVYQEVEENYAPALRQYTAVAAMTQPMRGPDGLPSAQELEAHYYMGKILLEQHRPQEAYRHFQFILDEGKDNRYVDYVAMAALGIGECLIETGQPQLAEQHLAHWARQLPGLGAEAARLMAGTTRQFRHL